MRLIAVALSLLISPAAASEGFISPQQPSGKERSVLITNAVGSDEKIIKIVTASGYGTSVDAAAQNAAENALTQVVGSFIDSETLIKKQKEIRDGVISKTKVIKKDIRDYSQGSIKYFEVLNVQQNGSIYNVTARVDVRVEDFRAYIKELAYKEKVIPKGLFTAILTDTDNQKERASLIHKKILHPITSGEVIEIDLGNIYRVGEFYDTNACKVKYQYGNMPRESTKLKLCSDNFYAGYGFNKATTLVFPVTLKLRSDFKENLQRTLNNISDNKTFSYNWKKQRPHYIRNWDFNSTEDYEIKLVSEDPFQAELYHFANVKKQLNLLGKLSSFKPQLNFIDDTGNIFKAISFTNRYGANMSRAPLWVSAKWDAFSNMTGCNGHSDVRGFRLFGTTSCDKLSVIFKERKYYFVLDLDDEIIRKTQRMAIQLYSN